MSDDRKRGRRENSRQNGRDKSPKSVRNPGAANGERLKVSSGHVLIIDQFMLSNTQLLAALDAAGLDCADKPDIGKLNEVVGRYGGCVVEISKGEWGVFREPFDSVMVLSPAEGHQNPDSQYGRASLELEQTELKDLLDGREDFPPVGRVFVDTRCLVFADVSLLNNRPLLSEFSEARGKEDGEKLGRDMLRKGGAAVRYGFNRYGDELGVFKLEETGAVALWPDVVE